MKDTGLKRSLSLASYSRESLRKAMCGKVGFPQQGPKRPLHEAVKVKPVSVETPECWRCQDLEISAKESCGYGAEPA